MNRPSLLWLHPVSPKRDPRRRPPRVQLLLSLPLLPLPSPRRLCPPRRPPREVRRGATPQSRPLRLPWLPNQRLQRQQRELAAEALGARPAARAELPTVQQAMQPALARLREALPEGWSWKAGLNPLGPHVWVQVYKTWRQDSAPYLSRDGATIAEAADKCREVLMGVRHG